MQYRGDLQNWIPGTVLIELFSVMLFNNSLCGLCVEVSDVGCFDIYIL